MKLEDLREEIATRLLANTALTAIVGQKIWIGVAAKESNIPDVVCDVGATERTSAQADNGDRKATFAVTCYCETWSQANEVAQIIEDEFVSGTGTFDCQFQDGECIYLPGESCFAFQKNFFTLINTCI